MDSKAGVKIPLTRGLIALVDEIDADLLRFNWQAHRKGYACRYSVVDGKQHTVWMHRVILSRMLNRELLPTEQADHIHGLKLDNRRSELRLATNQQNQQNKPLTRSNTSGFKGVSWDNNAGKWTAKIRQHDGKKKHLGLFDTPELAYTAYCNAAAQLQGEFARLTTKAHS